MIITIRVAGIVLEISISLKRDMAISHDIPQAIIQGMDEDQQRWMQNLAKGSKQPQSNRKNGQ